MKRYELPEEKRSILLEIGKKMLNALPKNAYRKKRVVADTAAYVKEHSKDRTSKVIAADQLDEETGDVTLDQKKINSRAARLRKRKSLYK